MAESYVPNRKNRERRAILRHKASLMHMRVEIKNCIHALLEKHELAHSYSDLFGNEDLELLHNLQLPTIDHQILQPTLQALKQSQRRSIKKEVLHV